MKQINAAQVCGSWNEGGREGREGREEGKEGRKGRGKDGQEGESRGREEGEDGEDGKEMEGEHHQLMLLDKDWFGKLRCNISQTQ